MYLVPSFQSKWNPFSRFFSFHRLDKRRPATPRDKSSKTARVHLSALKLLEQASTHTHIRTCSSVIYLRVQNFLNFAIRGNNLEQFVRSSWLLLRTWLVKRNECETIKETPDIHSWDGLDCCCSSNDRVLLYLICLPMAMNAHTTLTFFTNSINMDGRKWSVWWFLPPSSPSFSCSLNTHIQGSIAIDRLLAGLRWWMMKPSSFVFQSGESEIDWEALSVVVLGDQVVAEAAAKHKELRLFITKASKKDSTTYMIDPTNRRQKSLIFSFHTISTYDLLSFLI